MEKMDSMDDISCFPNFHDNENPNLFQAHCGCEDKIRGMMPTKCTGYITEPKFR